MRSWTRYKTAGQNCLRFWVRKVSGSGNYGAGRNDRLLRKELMAVLMNRFDGIINEMNCHEEAPYGIGLTEKAQAVWHGLADLMRQKELSEVVEALELAGILGHEEARHFLRAGARKQQVIKEATGLLQPLSTPPTFGIEGIMKALKRALSFKYEKRHLIDTVESGITESGIMRFIYAY